MLLRSAVINQVAIVLRRLPRDTDQPFEQPQRGSKVLAVPSMLPVAVRPALRSAAARRAAVLERAIKEYEIPERDHWRISVQREA
jgi:hypothetical protein